MNVVSKEVVKLLNLKVEPHPNPFRVASVNDHTLHVTQKCLVFIQMGDYCGPAFFTRASTLEWARLTFFVVLLLENHF